jgi:hypothetical protein
MPGPLSLAVNLNSLLNAANPKEKSMKNRFAWASALTLTLVASSEIQSLGLTNGVILITTRKSQDSAYSATDWSDARGPGVCAPGDAAMAQLLGDYGYSCRIALDAMLNPYLSPPGDPSLFLTPANPDLTPNLIILSGSSGGADIPPVSTNGIAVMVGDHTALSDSQRATVGSVCMYKNGSASDGPNGDTSGQYMKVLLPNHPIMQGIPLDAQGRVKLFRDAYPEENAHIPVGGNLNVLPSRYNVPIQWVTNAAPGTQIIGVLDNNTNRACFAVMDVGGEYADPAFWTGYTSNRLVHLFINENGSGNARRAFLWLTDLGRVIFVRSAKWAMGETLTPYQPLGLIRVSQVGNQQIKLAWDGTATKSYKILGTQNLSGPADFSNWQTVAQDIAGVNGEVSATLDISGAKQYAFLRVMPVP